MAINERLIDTEVAAANGGGAGSGNQEEGLILYLDANDVDSYDGDGSVWYDITNHEYKPTTNVSEHFNTVLFSPTSSGITSITGVGFQPDLVWTKNRDSAWFHQLYDSLRGGGKNLYPNDTYAENSPSLPTSHLDSLDSDGFTVDYSENIGNNHVAWCFKAGGAPTATNTATSGAMTANSVSIDGTLESAYTPTDATIYPKKISANTKLGFSTVLFTGTGNSNNKVPHGLGVPPELVIFKNLEEPREWTVGSTPSGWDNYLVLNNTAAAADFNYFDDFTPNSNVFEIYNGQGNTGNDAGSDFIAYCFTSKRGVSKVGSFRGTGAAGNKVYTGFEPAFILTKRSSSSGAGWTIIDNKRSTDSDKNDYLYANTSGTEATSSSGITFNRDGFTFNGASFNTSGQTHIYYAIAKNTNETELYDTDLELHLDPASYSGSGTTWTADTGSNATVVASRYDQELGDSFDISPVGESTIQIASGHGLNGTDFTLEFWYKWQSTPSAANRFIYDAGTGWNFFYYAGNGWRINNDDCATGYFSSSEGVTVGKWYHFVITQNSSQNKVYIDGELLKTTSVTSGTRSLAAFDFGSTDITADKPNCDIGQIRTYSSALTQDQIRQNFNFTKNDYPNGYNGTLNSMSGSNWNSNGYFNFTTNDYIDLTGNVPFSSSTSQTDTVKCITGWIKPDTSTSRVHLYSASSTSTSNDFLQIGWFNDLSLFRVNVRNGTTLQDSIKDVTITPTTNWVHIVVQVTETTTEVYLNGNSQTVTFSNDGSGTNTSWISFVSYASGVKHSIGRSRAVSPNYSDGNISKVKFYNKALTQAEITALYNEGE